MDRHAPMQPGWIDRVHQHLMLGKFPLENGAFIEDFSLSFVTHGRLNAAGDNAVLCFSAIGSTHHRLDFLIGSRAALDPGRFFIICVDAIGNGLTTSPSTSSAQARQRFPRFGIRDMVESARLLTQQHFGIATLFAVMGASMGAMQALQWAVSYPGSVRHLVAMTPMSKTTAWSAALNRLGRQAIESQPGWEVADAETAIWDDWLAVKLLSSRTPESANVDIADAAALRAWLAHRAAWQREQCLAPIDWVYQSWAYDEHDVGLTKGFGGNTTAALKSITARTLIAAPRLDIYNPRSCAEEAAGIVPGASLIDIPGDRGHESAGAGHPPGAAFLNEHIARFLGAG